MQNNSDHCHQLSQSGFLYKCWKHTTCRKLWLLKLWEARLPAPPMRLGKDNDRFCSTGSACDCVGHHGLPQPYSVPHGVRISDMIQKQCILPTCGHSHSTETQSFWKASIWAKNPLFAQKQQHDRVKRHRLASHTALVICKSAEAGNPLVLVNDKQWPQSHTVHEGRTVLSLQLLRCFGCSGGLLRTAGWQSWRAAPDSRAFSSGGAAEGRTGCPQIAPIPTWAQQAVGYPSDV